MSASPSSLCSASCSPLSSIIANAGACPGRDASAAAYHPIRQTKEFTMASYRKNEAREWAREHLKGGANVVIPSYTGDLKGLNENGIRHDIRQEIDYGFAGTLLVSEVAITLNEYRQFFEWANDESRGRLKLIHHASFNTFEENIEAVRIAEANGAELVLLSYPANFYAETPQDIYDYTKAYCDATKLAVM